MRKNKFKTSQEEQDEAFFGVGTEENTNRNNSGRRNTNRGVSARYDDRLSNDEELAKELQEQYLKNDIAMRNRENSRQEQEDMELAIRLQRMGSSGLVTSQQQQQHQQRRKDEERKRQEDEDAKLARTIQEEEQSSSHSRRVAANQQGRSRQNNHRANRNRLGGIRDHHTINALVPRCAVCNEIALSPISALGNLYHRECFKCVACYEIIGANEPFAIMTDDDGQRSPMHRGCYSNLYGLKCTVCRSIIQGDSDGRVSYVKHPFFQEVMCPSHNTTNHRKCTGCHRYEPTGVNYKFADLGDANRCVCYSCCRTVIVDSKDAKPLWDRVIRFFGDVLHLPIFDSMKTIPVLVVPHEALNSQLQHSNHRGSSQIMTRGLCLSEHQIGMNLLLPSLRFDRSTSSFIARDAESRGHTYFEIPKSTRANSQTNVSAILCLSGLPADLSASILAHEATHAWIKLHPRFNPALPIPPQVEEGVCQLVAMLFLSDGLEQASKINQDGDGPSDEKLRQYFKFSIETDTSEIYGQGYRKAAKAYAQIGIEALLSHIVNYREFPNI